MGARGVAVVGGVIVVFVFVFVLLFLEGVVVEGVAERCACGAEASEAFAGGYAELVDAHGRAVGVEGVGVDVPGGVEVEVEAFGEAQQQGCVDVGEAQGVGREVVALRYGEVFDERYFLFACGVGVGFYFHLEVVGE